jgi:hypothetical protein
VQLEAVVPDVTDGLERKLAKHAFRIGARSFSNHRPALTANGAACGRAAVLAQAGLGLAKPEN